TKAEAEIRVAAQPRYNLEMALLRWIYLRKLTPIEDLIGGVGSGPAAPRPAPQSRAATSVSSSAPAPTSAPAAVKPGSSTAAASVKSKVPAPAAGGSTGSMRDAFLGEIRNSKKVFYNTVVAQAQKIDVAPDRVTFTFSSNQRALCDQVEYQRQWL